MARASRDDPWPPLPLAGMAVVLAVVLAVCLNTSCSHPVPAAVPWGMQPSDTVPNHISCQFRGAEFCHPKTLDV